MTSPIDWFIDGDDSLRNRFLAKVRKGADGECWQWIGATIKGGRGQISVKGRLQVAARVAYQLYRGTIPSGMYVCHSCDNANCVNPSHLWIGTAADNHRDGTGKGIIWQSVPRKLCRHGHVIDGVRTDGRGRFCRTCKAMWDAGRYAEPRDTCPDAAREAT